MPNRHRSATTASEAQVKRSPARRGRPRLDGRVAITREEVLQAAEGLFSENGYAATTIRQIADELGAFTASIYNHFDTKESLLDGVISRSLSREIDIFQFIAGLKLPADVVLYKLVYEDVLSVAKRRLAPQRLFFLPEVRNGPFPAVRSMVADMISCYTHQIERGQREGLLRSCNAHVTAEHLFSLSATLTVTLDPAALGAPETQAREAADFGVHALILKPQRLDRIRSAALEIPIYTGPQDAPSERLPRLRNRKR